MSDGDPLRDARNMSDDELLRGALLSYWDPERGAIGSSGARAGTGLGERMLRTKGHEETRTLADTAAVAGTRLSARLAEGGAVVDEDVRDGVARVRGLVGAGAANMNPAVVVAELRDGAGGGCELYLRAAAREGLINQHTARKATAARPRLAWRLLARRAAHSAGRAAETQASA